MVTRPGVAAWLGLLCVAAVGGCAEISDPAAPCRAMQLGEAEPSAVVSPRFAAAFAMTPDRPFILHCSPSQDQKCELGEIDLSAERYGVERGDAVLLTSAGNYAVAIGHDSDSPRLRWFRLDRNASEGISDHGDFLLRLPESPYQILASLRGSDWLIARDALGRLGRYFPGDRTIEAFGSDAQAKAMKLVAVGHHHIVTRVQHGGSEELLLIAVDAEGSKYKRNPRSVFQGPAAERVAFTGEDDRLVATFGAGDGAKTMVFSAVDGEPLDRFPGALVSGRRGQPDIAGISAASPDGSHVAYRTPSGALALRDLEAATSCMVRSASGGNHRLAGFSAQGRLYMEAERGREAAILTWDPATKAQHVISTTGEDFHLAAAPGRELVPNGKPWATVVRNGSFATKVAGTEPSYLDGEDYVFIPRDDVGMFAVSTRKAGSGRHDLRVDRIEPVMTEARTYDIEAPVPAFERLITGTSRTCMATANPGVSYRCGRVSDVSFMSAPTLPTSEDPTSTDGPPDEVPRPATASCDPGGTPLDVAGSQCAYAADADECCYPSLAEACAAQCGEDIACDATVDGSGQLWAQCPSGRD